MRTPDNLLTHATATMAVIPEAEYLETMNNTVAPYLDGLRKSITFKRKSGQKVYCEYYPLAGETKGTIFISHGFSESAGKYHEVSYYFLQKGYSVCLIEHRGHGHSRHPDEIDIPNTPAYITDYYHYIQDMDHVIRNVLLKELPGPYYLFAHSMGGAIGALYMEEHPDVFQKAIFNAPMFEINRHGMTKWQMELVANVSCGIGIGHKFAPLQGAFTPEPHFEWSAATCEPRFQYYFNLQLQEPLYQNPGASLRWAKECLKMDRELLKPANTDKIKIPVLLFQAEDDFFVFPGGQCQFMEQIEEGHFYHVPGSKHEIYMSGDEVLPKYWGTIFQFLE